MYLAGGGERERENGISEGLYFLIQIMLYHVLINPKWIELDLDHQIKPQIERGGLHSPARIFLQHGLKYMGSLWEKG